MNTARRSKANKGAYIGMVAARRGRSESSAWDSLLEEADAEFYRDALGEPARPPEVESSGLRDALATEATEMASRWSWTRWQGPET